MIREYLTANDATQFGNEIDARKELLFFLQRQFPEYAVKELKSVCVAVESSRAICKVVPVENGAAVYAVTFKRTPGWLLLCGAYRHAVAAFIVANRKDDEDLAEEVRSALVSGGEYRSAAWQEPKKEKHAKARQGLYGTLAILGCAVMIGCAMLAIKILCADDHSVRTDLFFVVPAIFAAMFGMGWALKATSAWMGKLAQTIAAGSSYHAR